MAPRSKLTPEVQRTLVTAVRAGLPYDEAADLARVPRETLRSWRKRGAAGTSVRCRKLAVALRQARAASLLEDVVSVRNQDDKWKGRRWHAERLCPSFQLTTRVVVEQRLRDELVTFLDRLQAAVPPETYEIALRIAAELVPDDDDPDTADRGLGARAPGGEPPPSAH